MNASGETEVSVAGILCGGDSTPLHTLYPRCFALFNTIFPGQHGLCLPKSPASVDKTRCWSSVIAPSFTHADVNEHRLALWVYSHLRFVV